MKRVIVTGANGFVGSNIVSVLSSLGWFVYAVDLYFDNPAIESWDSHEVEQITSSCEDLPPLTVDALIHGAFITASHNQRNETPEQNLLANLKPLLAITQYVRDNNIQRSIYISSSAVYCTTPYTMIDESRPTSPLGMYAIAKQTMEHLIDTFRTFHQQDAICIRLGNIYGENEYLRDSRPHLSLIGQMIHSALTERRITTFANDAPREWTFAADIGYACDALLSTEILNYSLYHVASSQRHSSDEIADTIQTHLTETEIVKKEHNSNRPALTRLGNLDNTRLKQDTGFDNWTPLEEGIKQTIHAYQEAVSHA